ncbi:unnamed protein product [Ascophyllum nodosum]
MGEIRDHQDIYTDGKAVLDSPLGSVVRGENGLYRVNYGEMQVIWVPLAERSLQGLFEMTKHQGEYEIQDILNIGEDPLKARDYMVQVTWVGLDNEDPTWEPVEVIFKDVPKFLVRKLKQVWLPKRVKNALRQRYGIKYECRMNISGGFCCNQCIHGSILDLLERGFKEIM